MSDVDESGSQMPVTPRSSLGSGGLSVSSGSSISPSGSSGGSQGSAKTAVGECLSAWLNHLQIITSLCQSGYRLSQTIAALEPYCHFESSQGSLNSQPGAAAMPTVSACTHVANHFTSSWDDLARSSSVVTNTVKSHVITLLQEFSGIVCGEQEIDSAKARERSERIILENIQTLVHLKHQFCVACYDSFSPLIGCFDCKVPTGCDHEPGCSVDSKGSVTSSGDSQTSSPNFPNLLAHKHEYYKTQGASSFGSGSSSEHGYVATGMNIEHRAPSPNREGRGPSPTQTILQNVKGPLPPPGQLTTMKAPFSRGSRSPVNLSVIRLSGQQQQQRRWSEAAAGEVTAQQKQANKEMQMRRWSMPWVPAKYWYPTTRSAGPPASKLAVPSAFEHWQSKISTKCLNANEYCVTEPPVQLAKDNQESEEALIDALRILSLPPSRNVLQGQQQAFVSQQRQNFPEQMQYRGQAPFTALHLAGVQASMQQQPCMVHPTHVPPQQHIGSPHYSSQQTQIGTSHVGFVNQSYTTQQQQQQQVTPHPQYICQTLQAQQQQQQQPQPGQQQQQQVASTQSTAVQHPPPGGAPLIEEPASYEIWPTDPENRIPSIKFPPKTIEHKKA